MSKKPHNIKSSIVTTQESSKEVPVNKTIEYVKTCSDCKFWFQLEDNGPDHLIVGQCRQGPPTSPYKIVEGGTIHVYRLTLPLYPACGQFQSR